MTDMRYTWQSILLLIGSFVILVELAVDSLQKYPLTLGGSGGSAGGGKDEDEDDEEDEEEDEEEGVKETPPSPVKTAGVAPS